MLDKLFKNFKVNGEYSDLFKLVGMTIGLGIVVFGIMFILVLSVFSNKGGNKDYQYANSDQTKIEAEGGQKVTFLGLIQKIDLTDNELEVTNIEKPDAENITLNLMGYTQLKDEYGELMVVAQLELGDIAEIVYSGESKKIDKVDLSGKVWKIENLRNLNIDQNEKTITVGEDVYNYNNKLAKVYKSEKITYDDINQDAVLTLKGYKDTVWCVKVQKYYGYLAFSSFESYIGADVEIDSEIFKKVDVDNKIVLEPGEHKVVIKREDIEPVTKYVVIKEKETTTVDLGDVELRRGTVNFNVNIDDYTLNISNGDGSFDTEFTGSSMELAYGTYDITATRLGYDTVRTSISVKTPVTNVRIQMKKAGASSNSSVTITANVVKNEVYVDDKYVGTAPIEIKLSQGSHKIAVRSQGYISAVKQVDVEDPEESYDFKLVIENPYSNGGSGSSSDDVY